MQQAVVEWGGEVHRERIPRPVDRNLQPPVGGIDGTLLGRPHPKLAAERRDEGLPGGVAPVRIDHERVRPARRKRAAQLLVREDAALDAPRVVQHGEPRAVRVPQIDLQRQKWIGKCATVLVEKAYVRGAFSQTHGRGEGDVQPEVVRRHLGSRRIDRDDPG